MNPKRIIQKARAVTNFEGSEKNKKLREFQRMIKANDKRVHQLPLGLLPREERRRRGIGR